MKLKKRWKKYANGLFTLGLVLMALVGFSRHYDILSAGTEKAVSAVSIVLVIVSGTVKNIKSLWED